MMPRLLLALLLVLVMPITAWAQSIGAMVSANQVSAVSLQPTIPAGSVGDCIVCATLTTQQGGAAPAASMPPAWTLLASGEGTTGWLRVGGVFRELGIGDLDITVFYKIATTTTEGPPSFRYETATGGIAALCARYANVRPITTVGASNTGTAAAAATWGAVPAVTTTTANERVLTFVASKNVNALALGTANSFTLQAGGAAYDDTAGDATGYSLGLADLTKATAGLVTMPTWTQTGTASGWVGVTLTLVSSASPTVYGLAGPDQSIAMGLPVLLGPPETSGTDPGDTDPGATYHWRQIIVASEPYVKLSHIDKTNTMFIAPQTAGLYRFGVKRNAGAEDTVDITVVDPGADTAANTTFIDPLIVPATCTTYDPATRACGSGTYQAQKKVFNQAWFPLPTAGWRYVFRAGTHGYERTNNPGGNSCYPNQKPVINISGTNKATGTATAPVQFKTYKNGATYESVVITHDGSLGCLTNVIAYISSSSYVIFEGFEITATSPGVGQSGRGLIVGSGNLLSTETPSFSITARHLHIHDHGAPLTANGLVSIIDATNLVALQYLNVHHGGSGILLGVAHEHNKNKLPYNVFIHTVDVHHNYLHTGNSQGISPSGGRNSACYRCMSHHNADAGFNSEGPHMDSNSYWDSAVFRQDSELSPAYATIGHGNERGLQIGTINPVSASNPPYWRGGAYNRTYRLLSFDNMGNGINDSGGSVDGRYYNATAFNNCRRRSAQTHFAQFFSETLAGQGTSFQGSPAPATVLVNLASHWPRSNGCQNAGPLNWGFSNFGTTYTTQLTNSPVSGGNPNFVVADPPVTAWTLDAPESAVTVNTTMYTDFTKRTLNPTFGEVLGLVPQAGSPLIDAGTFVAGVHCDRADNNVVPYPAADPNCIHWWGSAPDIGAFEVGLVAPTPPPPQALVAAGINAAGQVDINGSPRLLRLIYDSGFAGANGTDMAGHIASRNLTRFKDKLNVYLHIQSGTQANGLRLADALVPLNMYTLAIGNAFGSGTVETNSAGNGPFDVVADTANFRALFAAKARALGTYLADEPVNTTPLRDNLVLWNGIYRTAMPNLLTLSVLIPDVYQAISFAPLDTGEIFGFDPYPIGAATELNPGSPTAPAVSTYGYMNFSVGEAAALARYHATANGKAPITVLQAFKFGSNSRYITDSEMWSHMVAVAAEGSSHGWWAMGVQSGALDTVGFSVTDRTRILNRIDTMSTLLASMEPVMLTTPCGNCLTLSTTTGNALAWRLGLVNTLRNGAADRPAWLFAAVTRYQDEWDRLQLGSPDTTLSAHMLDQSSNVRTRTWASGDIFAYNVHPDPQVSVSHTWHVAISRVEVVGENRDATVFGCCTWFDTYGGASSLRQGTFNQGHIYKVTIAPVSGVQAGIPVTGGTAAIGGVPVVGGVSGGGQIVGQ